MISQRTWYEEGLGQREVGCDALRKLVDVVAGSMS